MKPEGKTFRPASWGAPRRLLGIFLGVLSCFQKASVFFSMVFIHTISRNEFIHLGVSCRTSHVLHLWPLLYIFFVLVNTALSGCPTSNPKEHPKNLSRRAEPDMEYVETWGKPSQMHLQLWRRRLETTRSFS